MMEKSAIRSLLGRVAASVTVEPVLVLFSLSQGIYMITSQTVYIDKAGLFDNRGGSIPVPKESQFRFVGHFCSGLLLKVLPGKAADHSLCRAESLPFLCQTFCSNSV